MTKRALEHSFIITVILLLALIIYVLIKNTQLKKSLLKSQNEKKKASKELEKTKIESLRFSLNPHSFKNTLQTIEHLAKKTYNSVNSLSGIFDYMLYDAKNKFVPLEQEITFALKYLNLYRLRLDPTKNVNKYINEELLYEWGENKKIAPLIFAHFIENAFKHGDLNSPEAFIEIKIETLDDNTLIYSVRNKINEKKSTKKGGIGNGAFNDRLELLYKDKFEYDYSIIENIFSANLKLTIYDN